MVVVIYYVMVSWWWYLIVVSPECSALLRNFGVNANYLPYLPFNWKTFAFWAIYCILL